MERDLSLSVSVSVSLSLSLCLSVSVSVSVSERECSTRRSSLKGRERVIVDQTNIGTVSKATLGTLLRDVVERNITDFFEPIDIILN